MARRRRGRADFCRQRGPSLSTLARYRRRRAPANTTLWGKLTRFLEYPEVELSNNLAENSMRPVALAWKNWIHVGSRHAGPKVAAIVSIVETSRRLKIPIREYLAGVLPGIADVSIQPAAIRVAREG